MNTTNTSSSIPHRQLATATPVSILQNTAPNNIEKRRNLLGGSRVQHIQNTLPELPNEVWLNIVSQLTFKEIRKVKHLSQAFRDFSNYFNQSECPKYKYLDFSRSPQLSNEAIIDEIERPTFDPHYIEEISLSCHWLFSEDEINRILAKLELEWRTYVRLECLSVNKMEVDKFQDCHSKFKTDREVPFSNRKVPIEEDSKLYNEIKLVKVIENTRTNFKEKLIEIYIKLNTKKNTLEGFVVHRITASELIQIASGSAESIFQKIIGLAIYCERIKDLEWLLNTGMSASVRNTNDQLPMNVPAFHIAMEIEYAPFVMAQLLLKKGADITAYNDSGITALHKIAQCPIFEEMRDESISRLREMIRFIFEKDRNCVYAVDSQGNTPLHYAIKYSPKKIIESLIAKGSDIMAVNNKGENLLHLICKVSSFERPKDETLQIIELIMRLMRRLNSNMKHNYINAVDNIGNTPLYYADKVVKDFLTNQYLSSSISNAFKSMNIH